MKIPPGPHPPKKKIKITKNNFDRVIAVVTTPYEMYNNNMTRSVEIYKLNKKSIVVKKKYVVSFINL